MVAELAAAALALIAVLCELLHARRTKRVSGLAFGPRRVPLPWVYAAPPLRIAGAAALAWGLTTLLLLVPKSHRATIIPEKDYRHLLLVLDVSPSMRLQDAGPTGKESRTQRAANVLKSFFERVPIDRYKTSVVACYTEAKPVVMDTTDLEVVRNILEKLPMQYAFKPGPTNLFAGLEAAAKLAHPWQPRSTTLMILTDGDTVPSTGMPKLPASIGHVIVVGLGDPHAGRFLDGHLSRQDVSTLRQVAVRLGGTYHNGNEKHLSTDLLQQITGTAEQPIWERLTRREYALMACAAGASVLALLPVLLHYLGTRWRPGRVMEREKALVA